MTYRVHSFTYRVRSPGGLIFLEFSKAEASVINICVQEIKKQIADLQAELLELRRDFHRHPELGLEEHRTSKIIHTYLQECGIEANYMARTGVVGLLTGKTPGKTIMLRADIDALPIHEETALEFKSIYPGKMHACGHDGHTAMLLVAAKILSRLKEHIKGSIKFVFQPNEEDAGADLMVQEGVMENPHVDAAIGLHLWSSLKAGMIDVCIGPVMAASHYFDLIIKGNGGHAGFVHKSIDSINVVATIIQSMQGIQTREIDAMQPLAVVFTKLHAGSNNTIVPEKVETGGSIRFLHDIEQEVKGKFDRIVKYACSVYGADYELKYKVGNNVVKNDLKMALMVKDVAREVLETEDRVTSEVRTMAGDDFSEFALMVPSVYYFIGAGNEEKETDYPHHHPHFNIDEDVLLTGVEMHVRTTLVFLK